MATKKVQTNVEGPQKSNAKQVKAIAKLADLLPDTHNANKGTVRGRGLIQNSLQETGAGRSILVDKRGRVIAGNKTLEAAAEMGLGVNVVQSDGKQLVVVQRTDLDLSNPTGMARRLAYMDNLTAQADLEWNTEVMKEDIAAGVDLQSMFGADDLATLLEGIPEADDADQAKPSDGTLLQLVNITVAEPTHKVEPGDVYRLSARHWLVCADVMREWEQWIGYLTPGVVLAPYPGPFFAMSARAKEINLVLVQPDVYVAGHILDRYSEVNGESQIHKAK